MTGTSDCDYINYNSCNDNEDEDELPSLQINNIYTLVAIYLFVLIHCYSNKNEVIHRWTNHIQST